MDFDGALVARELEQAFRAYEAALVGNDVPALIEFFWRDPRAVRLAPDGGLYGFDDIAAFRQARDPGDLARDLERVDIRPLGADIGVVTCEYRRTRSGRRGAQSQVWARLPEGWRIVSAHVSLAPAPVPAATPDGAPAP